MLAELVKRVLICCQTVRFTRGQSLTPFVNNVGNVAPRNCGGIGLDDRADSSELWLKALEQMCLAVPSVPCEHDAKALGNLPAEEIFERTNYVEAVQVSFRQFVGANISSGGCK